MIKIENLNVYYNNKSLKAVENVSMDIEKGEICTILGQSGAGKSTILKVIAGINNDYDGNVYIEGKEVNPKTQTIGFIPQNYGLLEWKTIEQNILLSSKIKHGKKNIDMDLYKKLLNKLNIEKYQKSYPNSLSGGERQRVAIARGLILKPNVLLMDEPFSALDALTREDAQKLFLDIWREYKVTTVLITHDIKEAIYLGQKIIIMSSSPGRIEKVINNELFGKSYEENRDHIEDMILELREMLKGENNNENGRV